MVPVRRSPSAATIVAVPLPAKVPSAVGAPLPSIWTVTFPRWLLTPGTSPVNAPVTELTLIVPAPAPLMGRSVPPAFAVAGAGVMTPSASTRPASATMVGERPRRGMDLNMRVSFSRGFASGGGSRREAPPGHSWTVRRSVADGARQREVHGGRERDPVEGAGHHVLAVRALLAVDERDE